MRVNHSVEYVSAEGASVNQAESYFARLRRAEFRHPSPNQRQPAAAYANGNGVAREPPPRRQRHPLEPDRDRRACSTEIGDLGRLLASSKGYGMTEQTVPD